MQKRIKEYENLYTVDEFGNVYSIRKHKYLKTKIDKDGYVRVHLCDGKYHNKVAFVHRLVAEAFIENDDPINKTTVDHIDANKTNNHISNLRWLSASDNTALANKRRDCTHMLKPIKAINIQTHEILIFNSRTECANYIGGTVSDIWAVLNHKQKSAHGYIFQEV